MAGYAARRGPSQGVAQEIYAKALALEDATGQRSVLVTTDLLGFTAALAKQVAERAQSALRSSTRPAAIQLLPHALGPCGRRYAQDCLSDDR